MTTLTSARQVKAQDTRARIFAAAAELFSKHGYQVTTVDRIANHAGVAKGTFFVHFKSKDAVIAELVGVQIKMARKARQRALADGTPLDALRVTVLTLGELGAFSRALSRGVLTAVLDSQEVGGRATQLFDGVLGDMMADAHAAKRAGLLGRKVDPDTLARSLLVGYLGAVLSFASSGKEELMALLEPVVDSHLAAATNGAERGIA
jgi:AcrR family transcriptional regulator